MWSLLATTPSVTLNRIDVGGSTAGTQTTYFAYGYSGQNRPLIEGINTTEGTAASGLLPRLRVVRGSVRRRGGQLRRDAEPRRADAVRRQERRQPRRRSTCYFDYENESTSRAATSIAEQVAVPGTSIRPKTATGSKQLPELQPRRRRAGRGAIACGAISCTLNQQTSVAAPAGGSFLDGTPFNTKLYNYTGKVTFQVNQANKLIGYCSTAPRNSRTAPIRPASPHRCTSPRHPRCCRRHRAGSTRVSGTAR